MEGGGKWGSKEGRLGGTDGRGNGEKVVAVRNVVGGWRENEMRRGGGKNGDERNREGRARNKEGRGRETDEGEAEEQIREGEEQRGGGEDDRSEAWKKGKEQGR